MKHTHRQGEVEKGESKAISIFTNYWENSEKKDKEK